MQQSTNAITYGSQINFNLSQFPQLYFYSDGFMSNQFQHRSFHSLHGNLFHDFQNAVFRVIPIMNFKWQDMLLEELAQDDFGKVALEENLKKRKHLVQQLQTNLEGEINSNMTLNQKLVGTPLTFSSSLFHLVHVSSLKFVSLNDNNLEDLEFELVDFPNELTVLKFTPSLNFQKLRTNVVYHGDVVCLAANKLVCNRTVGLFSTYTGKFYEDVRNSQLDDNYSSYKEYLKEVKNSLLWASVDEQSQWRVNMYSDHLSVDKGEVLQVGDVIGLQLCQKGIFLNAFRNYDPFDKVISVLNEEDRSTMQDFEKWNSCLSMDEPIQTEESKSENPHQQSMRELNVDDVIETFRNTYIIGNKKTDVNKNVQGNTKRETKLLQEKPKPLQHDMSILKNLMISDLELAFEDIGFKSAKRILRQIPYSAFWKIECEQFQMGGSVRWEQPYRIRHFQTGRYLEVVPDENSYQVRLTNRATKNTIFSFQVLQNSKDEKHITKDSFFYLRHVSTGFNFSVSQKGIGNQEKKRMNATLNEDQDSRMDVFKMNKADFEEIWETRFLLFCIPLLMEAISYYGEHERKQYMVATDMNASEIKARLKFFSIFQSVNNMLDLLCSFANNQLISNIQLNQEFGACSRSRQNVIRTENVLPLLLWLLFKSFPHSVDFERNSMSNFSHTDFAAERDFIYATETQFDLNNGQLSIRTLEKLQELHQKRKVMLNQKLYLTAKELCRKNETNQLCMAKFLHLLERHIGHHSYVTDTLMTVFDKNHLILQSLSKCINPTMMGNSHSDDAQKPFLKEIVTKIMNFGRFQCPQLLQFWMSCCSLEHEAIFANQDMVFKTLMVDKRVRKHALMNIYSNDEQHSEDKGDIIIESLDRKGQLCILTLQQFLDESIQDGNPFYVDQTHYLKMQLNLFAQLCANRNLSACREISQIFSLDGLVQHALNPNLNDEIRAALYRLIRTIYLDREPFSIEHRPNLVRVCDPVANFEKHKKKQKGGTIVSFTIQDLTNLNGTNRNNMQQNPMFLYDVEDELFQQASKMDDSELIAFLHEFKLELLDYLEVKFDILCTCAISERVFNLLTLEVIKILQMMLQFGLFNRKPETKKKKYTKSIKLFQTSTTPPEKQSKGNDIERMVNYLAVLLEYDESYFQCLHDFKLQRKYQEVKHSQLTKRFTLLFTIKPKRKQRVQPSSTEVGAEEHISDPLFKKLKSLRKILHKFGNKTFTSRVTHHTSGYEVQIKIQICSVFAYLMDLRQEYLIDNTLCYFTDHFIGKTSKLSSEEFHKHSFDADFLSIFPEEMLTSGEQYAPNNYEHSHEPFSTDKRQPMKQYTEAPSAVRGFDQILQRPFSEVLLLSLYFTKDSELENYIVDLVQRFARQKKEFLQHLDRLQLLISPEQIQFYVVCYQMVEKLRNSVQYSQVWLQLDQVAGHETEINDTLDRIWKLESVMMKVDKSVTLLIKQSIFEHIRGCGVLLELIDKAFSVVDSHLVSFESQGDEQFKSIHAGKIIKLISTTLNVLGYYARDNETNQQLIYRRVVKMLLKYLRVNFGQVEMICELFKDNLYLFGALSGVEYIYFIDLIKLHGKYGEFLEFYDVILKTSEKRSKNSDIHKIVIQHLLDPQNFKYLHPFEMSDVSTHVPTQRKFYVHPPSKVRYLEKFLRILSRCINRDVGVNSIHQMGMSLNITDLLGTMVSESQGLVMMIHGNEQVGLRATERLRSACDILRVVCQNRSDILDQLYKNSKLLAQVVDWQHQFLQEKQNFNKKEIVFLFDSLLPVLNLYNETYVGQGTQAIMLSSDGEDGQYKLVVYQFSVFLCSHLEKIFFLMPAEIIDHPSRRNNTKRLAQTFNLNLPKNIFHKKKKSKSEEDIQVSEEHIQLESQPSNDEMLNKDFKGLMNRLKQEVIVELDSNESLLEEGMDIMDDDDERQSKRLYPIYQECWTLFRSRFKDSHAVKLAVKHESQTLSRTIWTISDMFQSQVNGEQKELLLNNEDIIVKILTYLQNWEANRASKANVIFILRVLSAILKADDAELAQRQRLYNKLGGAKIIMILIWEEQEMEPEYLCTLMKFLIRMIEGGNETVQQTIFEFFESNSSSEKLFCKLFDIMNMQIDTVSRSHKLTKMEQRLVTRTLRIIQLFCEGHYLDLQNYLGNQYNQKNSYDLVTHTVQLLSSIKISDSTFAISMQCLDTLTEMIQGPCRQNQEVISNSKFLEYAVLVLSEDEKIFDSRPQPSARERKRMDSKPNRGTLADPSQPYLLLLHPGRLARIKFNCLNTVMSLLECNEAEDSFILRIIRTIPLTVLTSNLRRIYQLFQQYSKEEYRLELFKRVGQDVEEGADAKDPEYYELILENGFNIYVLMQFFLSNQKAREFLYENAEMSDLLNEFSVVQESELEKILKGNIFSEIGKLGVSLLKYILGGIIRMKQRMDDKLKSADELLTQEEDRRKVREKQLTKKAISFFRENTCSIDIIRDNNLYQIYFPKLPYCKQLPKDVKSEFHNDVDRTSSKTKLTQLMVDSDQIIKLMKHEERLRIFFSYNPILGIFASYGKLWEQCAFTTTLVINIVICGSYSQFFMPESAGPEDDSPDSKYHSTLLYERLWDPRFLFQAQYRSTLEVILILGVIDLVFSSLVVFFFLVKRAPLKIQHIWIADLPSGFFKTFGVTFYRFIHSLVVLFQDFDFLYYMLYIIANIIGLTVHPFYFAIPLMDILKLDQLKTVTQAIWQPKKELGLAFLLLIIINYYVSIIGYIYFYDDYEELFIEDEPRRCTDLWQCMIVTFDWTFKFTGSIGARLRDPKTIMMDFLQDEGYKKLSNDEIIHLAVDHYIGVDERLVGDYYARFFFDNIVNIILVFILLNMIQGIIIDTFHSLRIVLQERTDDQVYTCFICGIERQKLDKSSDKNKGFFHHIKQEHYMWNYLFYKSYIEFKDSTEYNGNETFVEKKLLNVDTSWFPVKRARGLSDQDDDEFNNIEIVSNLHKKIKIISQEVLKTQQRMNKMNDQVPIDYQFINHSPLI